MCDKAWSVCDRSPLTVFSAAPVVGAALRPSVASKRLPRWRPSAPMQPPTCVRVGIGSARYQHSSRRCQIANHDSSSDGAHAAQMATPTPGVPRVAKAPEVSGSFEGDLEGDLEGESEVGAGRVGGRWEGSVEAWSARRPGGG